MKNKVKLLVGIAIVVTLLVVPSCAPGMKEGATAPEKAEPIVIAWIADQSGRMGINNGAVMQLACDEINEAGGILGRPVKLSCVDTKGEASLAIGGLVRALMDEHALMLVLESRSEIALACMEKAAALFPTHPHIFLLNACMADAVMAPIVNDYERYKFVFADYSGEIAVLPYVTSSLWTAKNVVGAERIALIYDDALWTKNYRGGYAAYNIPSVAVIAKETYGMEVVYNETLKTVTEMYLPVFEAINQVRADYVHFVCSGWRNNDVLIKHWVASSARDIPICVQTGTGDYGWWNITGGKILGSLAHNFGEVEVAITSETIPCLKKFKARGIATDLFVHETYWDIYFFKKAVETAGSTDIDAIIKAMEQIEIVGSLGKIKMYEERISPFFHGAISTNIDNPMEWLLEYHCIPLVQWQGKDKVEVMWPEEFAAIEKYKSPKQLREEAGWAE